MSSLETITAPLLYLIRHKKKTILASVIAAFIFTIVLFPYDDLSDMITELIAKNSQNQVFVQFDELGIGFFPPSLKMTKVDVETQFLPSAIKADVLRLAPSVAGFLAFSPGFNASIQNVMKGNLNLTYRSGKKIDDSTRMQKIDVDLVKIDMGGVSKFASLPIELQGQISAEISAEIDPNFTDQPSADVEIKLLKFRLPPSTIQVPMGGGFLPVALPNIELTSLNVKGRLKGAELIIEDGLIGKAGDPINGVFKGKIGLRLRRQGNAVLQEWGGYELKLKLSLDRNVESDFASYLGFISSYKTLTGAGSTYALRLSAPNLQTNFNISPLGAF